MIKKVEVWLLLVRVYDVQKIFGTYLLTIPCRCCLVPDHQLNLSCSDSLHQPTDQYLSMLEPRRRAVNKIGAWFHVLLPREYYCEGFFSDGTLQLNVYSLKLEIHKSKLVFLRRHALTRGIYLTITLVQQNLKVIQNFHFYILKIEPQNFGVMIVSVTGRFPECIFYRSDYRFR